MNHISQDRNTWIAAQVEEIKDGKSHGFFRDVCIICPECGFEQAVDKIDGLSPSHPYWESERELSCQNCSELFKAISHVRVEYSTARLLQAV